MAQEIALGTKEERDSNEDQRPQPGEGYYMNRDNEDPNLRCNSGSERKVPNLRNTQKVKYVTDITGFQLTSIPTPCLPCRSSAGGPGKPASPSLGFNSQR